MRISDWSSDVCSSDLIIRKAEPVAFPVADGGAFQLTGIDTKQNIVCVRIFLINIMGVIGGDDLYIVFFGESKQGSVHLLLFLHFVADRKSTRLNSSH